jgi:hypothetical protein
MTSALLNISRRLLGLTMLGVAAAMPAWAATSTHRLLKDI